MLCQDHSRTGLFIPFLSEQNRCVRNKELGFDSFHHIYQMIWYNRGFRLADGSGVEKFPKNDLEMISFWGQNKVWSLVNFGYERTRWFQPWTSVILSTFVRGRFTEWFQTSSSDYLTVAATEWFRLKLKEFNSCAFIWVDARTFFCQFTDMTLITAIWIA